MGQAIQDKHCPSTILIVDDDVDFLKIIADIIDLLGYRTICAEGGAQALREMKSDHVKPALAIIDFTMPKMSGLETLAELRVIHPSLKAILISGYGEAYCARGKQVANYRFLGKPFTATELMDTVRSIMIGLDT
jgi:DNA-binding NtrC family response regulator